MGWRAYALLILFGAFIVLLLLRPSLTCFGRKLRSPFYPLFRRKKMEEEARRLRRERMAKTAAADYGFHLDDEARPRGAGVSEKAREKAEDYGFKLD
ncbi:MAG: hypothetical protein FJY82_01270 [Candidatus Aminicenantes bacterium]|nr:hypothetical protein [Candidatus Aminicenantes bacterium]